MTRLTLSACLVSLLAFGTSACVDEGPGAADPSGPSFDLTVAPLLLPGVTDVNYTVTIQNKSENNITVVHFSSSGSGDGTGFARYVAPCDAATDEQPNKILLEVGTVWTGSSPKTQLDVDVPDLLIKEQTCTENQSTTVSFDVYGVQKAGQGFFDILIGFENIYCSAKLDCTSAPAMFPNANSSLVLGLVCAAGNTSVEDTTLYMNDIELDCGAAGTATIDPNRNGNLPASFITDASSLIDEVTVSRGEDALANTDELYWNVAIGLTDAAVAASGCVITAKATTAGGSIGASSPYTTVADYPYIDWNLTVVTSQALSCTQHPLGGGSGVAATFPTAGGTTSFSYEYDGPRRYVFATSDTYIPGTHFSSLADADAICQRHALQGGLEGSYAAWLSDGSTDAKDRVADMAYVLSDMTTAIDSNLTALTDGTIAHAINADESGAAVTGDVWTGTKGDGTVSAATCTNWTSSSAATTGDVGDSAAATASWTTGASANCDTAKRLYCFPAL